jgi:hypothetical protein
MNHCQAYPAARAVRFVPQGSSIGISISGVRRVRAKARIGKTVTRLDKRPITAAKNLLFAKIFHALPTSIS